MLFGHFIFETAGESYFLSDCITLERRAINVQRIQLGGNNSSTPVA